MTPSLTIAPTPANVANADLSSPAQWGRLVKRSAARGVSLYVRDLRGGHQVLTFVIWVK